MFVTKIKYYETLFFLVERTGIILITLISRCKNRKTICIQTRKKNSREVELELKTNYPEFRFRTQRIIPDSNSELREVNFFCQLLRMLETRKNWLLSSFLKV